MSQPQAIRDYIQHLRSEKKSPSTIAHYVRELSRAIKAGVDLTDETAREDYVFRRLEQSASAAPLLSAALSAWDRLTEAADGAAHLVEKTDLEGYLIEQGLTENTARLYAAHAARYGYWRSKHPRLPPSRFVEESPRASRAQVRAALNHLLAYTDDKPALFARLGLGKAYEGVVLPAPLRRLLALFRRHGWTPEVTAGLDVGDLYELSGGWSTPYDSTWYERMRAHLPPPGDVGPVEDPTGHWQPIVPHKYADKAVRAAWAHLSPAWPGEPLWRLDDGQRAPRQAIIYMMGQDG